MFEHQIENMYALINENARLILDSIAVDDDIQPYIWLLKRLQVTNVAGDAEFQAKYRRYWQMNQARLSPDYLSAYFRHLQRIKHFPGPHDPVSIAQRLHSIPTQRSGRLSLQFSFASKLVHMVSPRRPVYDSRVERFYFLPALSANEPLAEKLGRFEASYGFLEREYGRVLQAGLLEPAIRAFRRRFNVGKDYTDIKIVDTLIWKYTDLLLAGAIRDGAVSYA
ncbi:MAG: hypothetical protein U5L03_10065 [Burkholderiaceae bacterium]|nr:hypothetical protein [Burkholderiaceae bacterium]